MLQRGFERFVCFKGTEDLGVKRMMIRCLLLEGEWKHEQTHLHFSLFRIE